jgi:hypothetical protein
MSEAVVLGELELGTVTELVIRERRKLARHPIPGWDGDLVQDLGSAAVEIRIRGLDHGTAADPDAAPGAVLAALRAAAAAGAPLDFTASAAIAAQVEQVLIGELRVAQQAGVQDCFHYELACVQYVEPPPPQVGGFDAGFLDALGAAADAAALADAGALVGELGDRAAAASRAVQAGLEAIDEIADVIAGAQALAPLLGAAGDLIAVGGWSG